MISEEGPAFVTPEPEHQRRLVTWWLRSTVDEEEAAAMASSGYRPTPCGNCARRGCRHCDTDPAERVHGARSYDADPAFVRAVVNRLSRFPPELVQRIEPAIAALPPDERMVLLLADGGNLDYSQVSRQLKITRQTVARTHARALDSVVAAVWPPTSREVPS